MGPIINVLDENTIDKIAAGEVIERPMSIVKELTENAIDAGADTITIEIKDGGITYIRVTDNGCGIDKNQIRTAFLRHATSKIKSVEDLLTIDSLGFRGEALSSIAAVCKVELLTKVKEEFAGSRYVIEGGKEMSFDDVGIPDGTTFIIRHIFYNTPARQKFLKSKQSEAGYVSDYIEKIMLSHPDISFKFIVNSQTKLQSSGNGNIKDIIYNLYGKDIINGLVPINMSNGDASVKGFIGKPELSRSNRSFEIYYVNNRYIQSTIIRAALDEAYKPYLMLHKYPVVFLYFNISPDLIDINVHPTKKEIRFIEGDVLFDLLVQNIRQKLSEKELIVNISISDKTEQTNTEHSILRPEPFEINRLQSYKDEITNKEINKTDNEPFLNNSAEVPVEIKHESKVIKDTKEIMPETINQHKIPAGFEKNDIKQISLFDDNFISTEGIIKHRIIGQIFGTYWLVEMDNKLYIIDQHAAHEKIKYERIIKQLKNNNIVVSQTLIPPIIVTLSKSEEATLNRYNDNFKRLGFEVEPFGGNEYAIREIPVELFGLTPTEYFNDLIDELMNDKVSDNIDSVDYRIATMACKSAVKGNTNMSLEEARTLIDELLTLDNPYNCPHGRPTIISFTKYEIEKMFKRIVN